MNAAPTLQAVLFVPTNESRLSLTLVHGKGEVVEFRVEPFAGILRERLRAFWFGTTSGTAESEGWSESGSRTRGWLAQLVRAPVSHTGGHRFESCTAHSDNGRPHAQLPSRGASSYQPSVRAAANDPIQARFKRRSTCRSRPPCPSGLQGSRKRSASPTPSRHPTPPWPRTQPAYPAFGCCPR